MIRSNSRFIIPKWAKLKAVQVSFPAELTCNRDMTVVKEEIKWDQQHSDNKEPTCSEKQ